MECIPTRRNELTRQAARLFAQKGYHGTSMGDLAQAMGVQKGSLYSLTESKQELLYETMREGADAFHAGLYAIPEDLGASERISHRPGLGREGMRVPFRGPAARFALN